MSAIEAQVLGLAERLEELATQRAAVLARMAELQAERAGLEVLARADDSYNRRVNELDRELRRLGEVSSAKAAEIAQVEAERAKAQEARIGELQAAITRAEIEALEAYLRAVDLEASQREALSEYERGQQQVDEFSGELRKLGAPAPGFRGLTGDPAQTARQRLEKLQSS